MPNKYLIHHLYSNGDCLFATVIARQIKANEPDCHLTWYVASQSKGMLINNPNIDEIVEVDTKSPPGGIGKWLETENNLKEKVDKGEFSKLFSTQIIYENEKFYTGTIRSTILNIYNNNITVPVQPQIFLTPQEKAEVEEFVSNYKLKQYKNVVLFECQPLSGQVPITPESATKISENILKKQGDTCFVLTSGKKIETKHPHIYDASSLSIRQNAELAKYCTHLVGCSSGISWLSISEQSKKLPMFQFLDNSSFYFNSMVRDFSYLKEDASHIIETNYISDEATETAILSFIQNFSHAHKVYHKNLKDKSRTIYSLCRRHILEGNTSNAVHIIKNTFRLNKNNIRYYITIIKLLVLLPLFLIMKPEKRF